MSDRPLFSGTALGLSGARRHLVFCFAGAPPLGVSVPPRWVPP